MKAQATFLLLICCTLWLGNYASSRAAEGVDQTPGAGEVASGSTTNQHRRPAWTTSRVTGSPEPAPPYRTERVYPQLEFKEPVTIARMPHSNRLLVMQLKAGIVSFVDDANPTETAPFFDFAAHVKGFWRAYGIAFHPQFEENRYCYVCYVLTRGEPLGSRVSRFQVADADPPYLIPDSEQVLLAWPSGGHNGGSIQFGADGYLYISTGDGSDPVPPDIFRTGQNLGDLRAKILRIDVNNTTGDLPYTVPADNPFVEVAEARPEVWAYGVRNPWKMVFDPTGKELWLGDVGWEMWEQIHRIVRGGNYGWSVMEASQPIHPESTRGPTAIVKPVVALSRSEALSITGGVFYQKGQLEELRGAYTYGDFITGTIWALKPKGEKLAWQKVLAQTTHEIIDFGTDRDGELLVLDHGGTIHKLVRNETADRSQDFPRTLSETGLFEDVSEHKLASGVTPYNIAAKAFADGTTSELFLALPGTSQIGLNADRAKWVFPKDAVLGKTISLNLDQSWCGANDRRIETQLMHFDGIRWNGYTYAWNDEQTDAALVPLDGSRRSFEVIDKNTPGGHYTQAWHFQSRSQCGACHNRRVNFTVAFDAMQLTAVQALRPSTEIADFGTIDLSPAPPFAGQFDKFVTSGYFTGEHPKSELVLCNPHDSTKPMLQRARSYLHANCAHCHRHGGGGNAQFKLQYDFDLDKAGYIGTRPVVGTFGLPRPAVIAPGDPFRSALYYRMAKTGGGRMPHIGAEMVDQQGLHLMHDWIVGLKPEPTAVDSAEASAGEVVSTEPTKLELQAAAAYTSLRTTCLSGGEIASDDAKVAACNLLLSNTTGALRVVYLLDTTVVPPALKQQLIDQGAASADPNIRDLFERYLPEDRRVKRLGSIVDAEELLSLPGDIERGRTFFFEASAAACKNCHRIGEVGGQVGPELTQIAKKLSRPLLLESILDPSKTIDPKYVSYLLETDEGRVYSGLLKERTDERVILIDGAGKEIEVATESVEVLVPQQKSLMPDLLFRDLTAAQLADLLAYLASLKE